MAMTLIMVMPTGNGISATIPIPNMAAEQGFDQGEVKSEIEEGYFTEKLNIETLATLSAKV
eukprot:CAMPEP_0203857658 /NCGR_PEP_ID=MMETSP0359-20131031/10853_1 /ASSEMBLY_ACC=CAM_ASM_000338 /TAXON_ID=268821 /ORGANISM="Scrippsiella Hangoei, Strain SHTV-5" /LENGTH=60 /DNA_ID=CAMNT_0050774377 /DNA_START=263 /DNA_END=441 /DNA_ORIENTATION=+